uniref:Uncharacterized protein n=1 Tax=Branchiostoma floridae TaxID=7739 RepID=C3ZC30_BRAFL|eukprot:XP_002593791.1 hypothetical protein BRAFLDRAFT_121098 [Branchiostoma floridae]
MMHGKKWGGKWGKKSMKQGGWAKKSLPSWKPNKELLGKQRVSDLQKCCSATGEEQVSCFEAMRLTNIDQTCHFSLEFVNSIMMPCCELSGEERLSCMDQSRYGFDSQIHSKDYTKNITFVQGFLHFVQMNMMSQRPPAFNEQTAGSYCQKVRRDSLYSLEESEEPTLLRLDPLQRFSMLSVHQERCCRKDGQEAAACLEDIRQKRVNKLCEMYPKVDQWMDTLVNKTNGTYLHKYVQEAVTYIKADVPEHRCCRSNDADRMSCFAQEWRPYSPAADSRDFSAELSFYNNKMNDFANVAVRWLMSCPYIQKMMSSFKGGKPMMEMSPANKTVKRYHSGKDIDSVYFFVPRGEDTIRVEEICKKVSYMTDNPTPRVPSNFTVSAEVAKRRVAQLGECCSYESTDRAECFDSLRQNSADEVCESCPKMNRHLLPEYPCCAETGSNRLMCMDQKTYGYDEDRHTVDFSAQLDEFYTQKFILKSVMDPSKATGRRMNATATKTYCDWKQKMSQKKCKKVMWGIYKDMSEIWSKKAECCQKETVEAQQECMNGVFQTRVDDVCIWLEEPVSDSMSTLEKIARSKPSRVCCELEGQSSSRYDCFAQAAGAEYNPYTDSRDYSDILQPYHEEYSNLLKEHNVQVHVKKPARVIPARLISPCEETCTCYPCSSDHFVDVIESRVANYQQCCSTDADSLVECFNNLRQSSVDEHCQMEQNAPHREVDIAHPCCEVTDGRLQCFDQQLYKYTSEIHDVDFSDELHKFHSGIYKMKSMWNKWEDRWAEALECCALDTSEERQDCLDGLREEKNNLFCQVQQEMGGVLEGSKIEQIIRNQPQHPCCVAQQEMSGVLEGSKIDQIIHNQPQHPCCVEEGELRSDCFDQDVNEYNPYKHAEDFTQRMQQYEQDFQEYLDDRNIKAVTGPVDDAPVLRRVHQTKHQVGGTAQALYSFARSRTVPSGYGAPVLPCVTDSLTPPLLWGSCAAVCNGLPHPSPVGYGAPVLPCVTDSLPPPLLWGSCAAVCNGLPPPSPVGDGAPVLPCVTDSLPPPLCWGSCAAVCNGLPPPSPVGAVCNGLPHPSPVGAVCNGPPHPSPVGAVCNGLPHPSPVGAVCNGLPHTSPVGDGGVGMMCCGRRLDRQPGQRAKATAGQGLLSQRRSVSAKLSTFRAHKQDRLQDRES